METRVTLGSPLLSKSILSGNILMLELDASGEAVAAAAKMAPYCKTQMANFVCKVCSKDSTRLLKLR